MKKLIGKKFVFQIKSPKYCLGDAGAFEVVRIIEIDCKKRPKYPVLAETLSDSHSKRYTFPLNVLTGRELY